ncbi:MAG: hypothetical protein NTW21_38305 [Verrucomicrobia bacterium]|nr:hypothetical protein [Verrucomicrobiota bacterium]
MKRSNICILLALAMPATVSAGVTAPELVPSPIQPTSQGDWMAGLGAGVQVGTQGVGIHLSYNITPSFYLQLEGNYFDYNKTLNIADVDYESDLDLSNLGLTVNYLPFENSGFRITAGAFFANNEISCTATGAGQQVSLNNVDYTLGANDSLVGAIDYGTFNPYIGVGWDWVLGADRNFVIGLDVGVSYLGEPDATLTGTGLLGTSAAANDLAAEQAAFQDDVEGYKFYPVVKVSFTYRF